MSMDNGVFELPNTVAYVEEEECGSGTLSIGEDALCWKCGNNASDKDIYLSYPYISIHAVSRDISVFPFRPCVFLVYSVPDEANLDKELTTHYRLVPPEPEQLEVIFGIISDCQKLYPDADLSSDSDASLEEGNYFTTADGLEHITAEGEAVLSHLESILHIQDQDNESGQNGSLGEHFGQFDDADSV